MEFVIEHVKKLGARSVKTCVLLDKPSRRKVDLKPDYCCFIKIKIRCYRSYRNI